MFQNLKALQCGEGGGGGGGKRVLESNEQQKTYSSK